MQSLRARYWLLVSLVFVSGFTQGMLLPLLAILLEQRGVPSYINGMHATGLYIGVLIASPFLEKPLQRFGYKPLITIGTLTMIVSLLLFPVWDGLWFWFVLRLVIGIGDNMLHFATQTWITSTSEKDKLGRSIAFYGLSFGFGFAVGPLMTRFIDYSMFLPFFLAAGIITIIWLLFLGVRNERPGQDEASGNAMSSIARFGSTLRYAWIALLPPLGYGLLEATLHSSFPVFGMRQGMAIEDISFILPMFALGGMVSQLPLGMLSDRFGRRPILLLVHFGGFLSFLSAIFFGADTLALALCFFTAGLFLGSTFSLGISYMTDLLPKNLLPAGNILCGVSFSLGSISGPFMSGLFIEAFGGHSFFYTISFPMLIIFICIFLGKRRRHLAET
ncbi:MFS transporter [Aureibacillus halotolerans]|uniref:Putative MFS family arabinose efflux permease n=1 Tax=Aureibacillus halotolerans TaxID=1508390 RepID=A0A4R6TSV4_9BACI|nr:MFS transporter [Aureibacillus halotolerans]TDQ36401.1 putative MFS family arabinose efflux permease [Aureibacillus halotolerans]